MKHSNVVRRRSPGSLQRTVWRHMVHFGLNASLAFDQPVLSRRMVTSLCRPLEGDWPRNARRIWMLGKEGLTEDLIDSVRNGNWAYPFDFSRGVPKAIARKYLPACIDDNNYTNDGAAVVNAKTAYRDAWRQIFSGISPATRPHAIATGNFGYYAERELAHAAEMEGIPFIALHKECLKSQGRLEFFKEVYRRRGAFKGRRILVYNRREHDLQITAGIAEPGQVVICGMPRLDRLHRWRQKADKRADHPRTLLALGFTPKTGLPRIPRKGKNGAGTQFEYLSEDHENMSWDRLFQHFHESLVTMARDNPDWTVLLKLKSRQRDAEPSVELVRSLDPPDNLELVVGGDPVELFKISDVVLGFNTTAALEGIAAGLPVVIPDFDEIRDPEMRSFAAMFEAAHKPQSPDALRETISALMRDPASSRSAELTPDAIRTLDEWVGNADGKAGERVRAVFENEMSG